MELFWQLTLSHGRLTSSKKKHLGSGVYQFLTEINAKSKVAHSLNIEF